MIYFGLKKDLARFLEFRTNVFKFWEIEAEKDEQSFGYELPRERQQRVQSSASRNPEYQNIRSVISKDLEFVKKFARKLRVSADVQSLPPPAVGGAIIPVNYFDALLEDYSHGGVSRQTILDTMNKTEGVAEELICTELFQLLNPLYWIKEAFVFFIRIPFILFHATGFNVSKFEDHFIGKFFKLAEILFLFWVLLRLGVKHEDIKEVFMKIFIK